MEEYETDGDSFRTKLCNLGDRNIDGDLFSVYINVMKIGNSISLYVQV